MCQKKHPRLASHSFVLLYPYPLDTSQFLQHHSAEGAFIIDGVTLRRKLEVGTPSPGDMEPRGFPELFQPRLHILWVLWV